MPLTSLLAVSLWLFFIGFSAAEGNSTHSLDSSLPSQPSHSSKTAVTMIVLYAVTGCVSAAFILIIVSGAIRAIRHPERYGGNFRRDWGHSTARGLTRAILDTFPTIKFTSQEQTETKDVEANPKPNSELAMAAIQPTPISHSLEPLPPTPRPGRSPVPEIAGSDINPVPGPSSQPESSVEAIPDAIGRETCPICILDFEEGDDLRVLPCAGGHRFHRDCVDPWLLELSTACPICRHDFITLENMITGSYENPDSSNRRSSGLRRLSRYVRFARHRREQDAVVGE